MINFIEPCQKYNFGCIKVETGYDESLFSPPLKFQVYNTIDGLLKWETSIGFGCWAEYYEPCNKTIILVDSNSNIISFWSWDTIIHGDIHHKEFLSWSINNKGSRGLAIGTNDGTTGEWVYPVTSGLLKGVLVEATKNSFDKLVKNYEHLDGISFENEIITTNGSDCIFYESGNSVTNSLSKQHVMQYTETNDSIIEVKSKSLSISDLIIRNGLQNDMKWLHLDVEGIDDELILAIDESKIKLPQIIIYESLILDKERKNRIISWLESRNYRCIDTDWNSLAIRS